MRRHRASAIALLLLCLGAVAAAPACADSPPAMSWSAPLPIDVRPPFASEGRLRGVSCPSASLCVAAGNHALFVSTDPTGGFDD